MRGKSVVVTGAASGIGEAVALRCAQLAASVAVLDICLDKALTVAEEVQRAGAPRSVGIECDVSSEASVEAAFEHASQAIGAFDAVFANAGIEVNGPLHHFELELWRRVLDVNLTGVFLTCRQALTDFVERGAPGSIVCTSSPAAFVGFSGGGNSAYAASKGGVSAFVRSAALDYAPRGIRVNAVVPGATETAMLVAGISEQSRPQEFRKIRSAAAEQIPLGRLAKPDEVASAVVWLLSDDSSYVTGTNLVCDGGLMAKSANDF